MDGAKQRVRRNRDDGIALESLPAAGVFPRIPEASEANRRVGRQAKRHVSRDRLSHSKKPPAGTMQR